MSMNKVDLTPEPLLTEVKSRHVLYPIIYNDIFDMYKRACASTWFADEINFDQDLKDLERLNENEKHFIMHVLAFFAASDGIVMENLGTRFMNDIKISEAKAFYAHQLFIEQIHSETYSLLIDTYVKDREKKAELFDAVRTFPAIEKKASWGLQWVDNMDAPFAQRLIAFAIVEGLFFSASFCAIFWMRKRGLLPGLSFANQLISRDEGLHTEFACLLYTYIKNRVPVETVRAMIEDAVRIEEEFIIESIPCNMIGMNADLMREYIKYVADRLLVQLGYDKLYNVSNPFEFMEMASCENKTNYFERRVAEYAKAGVAVRSDYNDRKSAIPDTLNVNLGDDF